MQYKNMLKPFNRNSPAEIYDYSENLIGNSLHSLLGDVVLSHSRAGKGGLGQMVEELFFGYDINNHSEADFSEAGLELKCTPLLKSKTDNGYRIKERLVCTMIDYFSLVNTSFEESHLLAKCKLMLLLFYLHCKDKPVYDFEFIYRILWQLPDKDLIQIKHDYETIAAKVKRGEAHLLSEGDTLYLGACRKGQKGESLQKQPCSDIGAKKRAFSLKPAYMRYLLKHVTDSGNNFYSNYSSPQKEHFELTTSNDLKSKSFEEIITSRFKPYIGLNFNEICSKLGIEPYQSKNKYADVCGLIASNGISKRLSKSDEFVKSGITMKTIRLRNNGMPKESMSFKNINFCEVFDNDIWEESEAYEIFTTRFMFVVFAPVQNKSIKFVNAKTNETVLEPEYVLKKVFFWTMPTDDLNIANQYWLNIRQNTIDNNLELSSFWSLSDHNKFHVRPKAAKATQLTVNPHGGECKKYCYWLNAEYVKEIIDNASNNV